MVNCSLQALSMLYICWIFLGGTGYISIHGKLFLTSYEHTVNLLNAFWGEDPNCISIYCKLFLTSCEHAVHLSNAFFFWGGGNQIVFLFMVKCSLQAVSMLYICRMLNLMASDCEILTRNHESERWRNNKSEHTEKPQL